MKRSVRTTGRRKVKIEIDQTNDRVVSSSPAGKKKATDGTIGVDKQICDEKYVPCYSFAEALSKDF